MKKLTLLLVIGIFSVVFTSCDKEDKPEDIKIGVDETELSFTQKEEIKEFNISYPDEWHLEAEGLELYICPDMADVKDFTVAPVWGKGNAKVSVTLRNEITESYAIDLKVVGGNDTVVVKLKANAYISEVQ
jgi:hypothetical protein